MISNIASDMRFYFHVSCVLFSDTRQLSVFNNNRSDYRKSTPCSTTVVVSHWTSVAFTLYSLDLFLNLLEFKSSKQYIHTSDKHKIQVCSNQGIIS